MAGAPSRGAMIAEWSRRESSTSIFVELGHAWVL
jgi:hypothetical protein